MKTSIAGQHGPKTIKKNSTQKNPKPTKLEDKKVMSFLSTDCELSTETCSKNVYSLDPWCCSRVFQAYLLLEEVGDTRSLLPRHCG